jgi:Na+/H+ antiporter NhaC
MLSLLPPVITIVLAIATRRVIPALAVGVLTGAAILSGGRPVETVRSLIADHLRGNLIGSDHLQVFAFTLLMGAMVGVLHRSGGMHGVVDRLSHLASNRRRGQLTTWLMGLVIFFDDYANTLLLGGAMRPLTDRLRISREKLAYLVDSTAAPVAGLAVVSTWVAGEIGFIVQGLQAATVTGDVNGFAIFVATIPYRFYVLLALAMVALVAWLGRDFGPMLAAERRALGPNATHGDQALVEIDPLAPSAETPRRWPNAVAPIIVTVAGILAWLVYTGGQSIAIPAASFWDRVAAGNSYEALVVGSDVGLITALLLVVFQGLMPVGKLVGTVLRGAWLMMPALMILWLAWTLAEMTDEDHLGTGEYIARLIGSDLPVALMPTLVFVLSGAIAFSTGTSWGTMGIVMPLVIPITCDLLSAAAGRPPSVEDPLLLAVIGSVLAGAIFGDHCSPISDTTVLSSQASGCQHMEHVRTQLPYALLVAAVAIVCGTLPAGFGAPAWALVGSGLVALALVVRVFGRRAEDEA